MIAELATCIFWGLRNRARGWGDGWAGTQNPKWLIWVQKHIFNRYYLAFAGAIPIAAWVSALGWSNAVAWQVFGIVSVGWFVGVVKGIGDYQDMQRVPNREIDWIDRIVQPFLLWLAEWMLWNRSAFIALHARTVLDWSHSPRVIDNASMGLRGVYMLPMFVAMGFALEGWQGFYAPMWLPIAFFWQQGAVYYFCRRIKGDYVMWCELADDTVRCALILAALLM